MLLLIIAAGQSKSFGATKRCLFIGDSYFSHNDLSQEFLAAWNIVTSDTLLVTSYCRDGTTIIRHWRNVSGEVPDLVRSQMWDYVIIQLPSLSRPQDSTLSQVLHEIDSSLRDGKIICITMDFCYSFPEMACANHPIEGIVCNEFFNCTEKMTHIKSITDQIINQKYRNSIQIIPFAQYSHFLHDRYSITLGSDDDWGHPSSFSQSCLARFILLHIMNLTTSKKDTFKTNSIQKEAIHFSSFYNSFYNEKVK